MQTHGDNQHFFNYSTEDKTYWIGPGLGHRINHKTMIGAGLAYKVPKSWSVELDLSDHFPTSYELVTGNEEKNIATLRIHRRHVLDVNLGAEYYVTERYPLRVGFFTSRSSAPDPETEEGGYGISTDEPQIK